MSDQGAGQERSSHLPLPGVNLIGRAAERKAIGSAIDNGSRLITLTGPGGIGKSALALATARDLESRFSGGAWFVPLAGLRFPQLLESEIGRVLGMHEPSDGAMQDALCARLASSRTLLILDNFSHLHEAIPVIEALIDRSPDLHMVVTSRSPLGITGEQVLPVPPLTTPVE
ncbi:MAG: AAA family ATPase, partial [Thermomicrobiales bacterium]